MDKIIIQGLQLHSLIGVYDWERLKKQPLLVDVELDLDLSKAAKSDDVKDTIDYAELASVLEEIAGKCEYQLLEALADKMIQELHNRYPTSRVTLSVTKPDILSNAKSVSVQLSRKA